MIRNRVLGLFKFGERVHIEKFVQDGHLFMNTLAYFKKLEGDHLRSDEHEGAALCIQADGSGFQVKKDGVWVEIATIRNQILSSRGDEKSTKVFCMYALRENASHQSIDWRNLSFGDAFAALIDGDEFLGRVKAAAQLNGIPIKLGLVEYVDRATYNGPMGALRKFSDFGYQSEFRIAINSEMDGPFSLRVGGLSDISVVGNLCDLCERIKIESNGTLHLLDEMEMLRGRETPNS